MRGLIRNTIFTQFVGGETLEAALAWGKKLGKECIIVKEAPAFAVNRILCTMINEAFYTLDEGVATAEDIDKGMVLGCNHPIGPLALSDLIGNDTLISGNGDIIELDVAKRKIHLHVSDAELARRKTKWKPLPPHATRGWVKLYCETVLQADRGADLDFLVGNSGSKVGKVSH